MYLRHLWMHGLKCFIVTCKVSRNSLKMIELYDSLFVLCKIGNKVLQKRYIALKAASHHHALKLLYAVYCAFNKRYLSFVYKCLGSISFRTCVCLIVDIFKQRKNKVIRHFKEMIISFKTVDKIIPCFFLMPFNTISGAPLNISHRLYSPSLFSFL